MNTQQALFSYTVIQLLQGRQITIFVLVAGLARVGNLGIIQGVFRQQGHKRMGVIVPGLRACSNSWHVATDAVGKRMDRMSHVIVNHLMAYQALLRTGPFGLKLRWRHT
jgi:hypothetical protein